MANYNDDGRQVCDSTPVEVPLRMQRPETQQEMFQRLIREHISQQALANEMESFEEADDFDVQDEFDSELNATIYEEMSPEVPIGQDSTIQEPVVTESSSTSADVNPTPTVETSEAQD